MLEGETAVNRALIHHGTHRHQVVIQQIKVLKNMTGKQIKLQVSLKNSKVQCVTRELVSIHHTEKPDY